MSREDIGIGFRKYFPILRIENHFSLFWDYFPLTNNLFSFDLFFLVIQTLKNEEKHFPEEYFPQTNGVLTWTVLHEMLNFKQIG